MPTLIVDSQGRPMPQILDRATGNMAPWQGKNGAGDMNLIEYTPQAKEDINTPTKGMPVVLMVPDATGGFLLPVNRQYGVTVDVARVQGVVKLDTTTPLPVESREKAFDGTSWTDSKEKVTSTLLTSAARVATTTTAALTNVSAKAATLVLDVVAGSGIISKVELLATINGNDYVVGSCTLPSLVIPGTYIINIGINVNNQAATHPYGIQAAIPTVYKYRVVQNTTTVTYSLHEIAIR